MSSFEPSRDAVEMEGMIADPPSDGALLIYIRYLVCLTLDARVHDVVTANGAVIDVDIPSPEGDGIPLLDLEALGDCSFHFVYRKSL